MTKIFRFLSIIVLMTLILTSCSSALPQKQDLNQAVTVMEVIYGRVYNGTIDVWAQNGSTAAFLWGVFAFLIVVVIGFMIGASNDNMQGGCITGIIAGLVVGILVMSLANGHYRSAAPKYADAQGVEGMTSGFSKAQDDKANLYMELLHVPAISATIDQLACETKATNRRSNCYPYEWTYEDNPHDGPCNSWDKDGNCTGHSTVYDTEHVGYFEYLVQYRVNVALLDKLVKPETGLMVSSTPNLPGRYLSDHWTVPLDYEQHWADKGPSLFGNHRMDIGPNDTFVPPQWTDLKNRLDVCAAGPCNWPLINVPHRYLNWIFASDTTLLQQQSLYIQQYTAANLLPTMNWLYSRNGYAWATDYDFVQFVGGLSVPQDQYYAWQDAAASFSAYFGNTRQGSLDIVFAPRAAVEAQGSIDQWADGIKAYLSQKDIFAIQVGDERVQRMMPKNNFIIACMVDGNVITACRIRTAMPEGNEVITETFRAGYEASLQNMQFSPQSFFGNFRIVEDLGREALKIIGIERDAASPMDLTLRDDPNGLRRVSMSKYSYLKADIKLSSQDVDKLVSDQIAIQQQKAEGAVHTALWAIGILILLVVGGFIMLQSNS